MKKILTVVLILAIAVATGVSVYAFGEASPEVSPKAEIAVTANSDVPAAPVSEEPEAQTTEVSVPDAFPSLQDEIIYKMLNSMDYFTTAQVSFSAVFPGFDTAQDYTIETNLETGVSHQTCSDNFVQTRSANTSEAYETYSDGEVVREYDNLARTVQTLGGVQARRSLEEEWPGVEDRYYVDENGDPHYRYRGNPTNADMAGECLLPQVSAFAYLMDKGLWEVVDTTEYCGRQSYFVEGTVNGSYSAQIGADTFMMYVDQETGILLKLEAYDASGNIVSSMAVSEITVDAPSARSSFAYDMSKYEGYTELSN